MESTGINLTCTRCKKKRATTDTEAASLFGLSSHTKKWFKQCIECREKRNFISVPENIKCSKCGKESSKTDAALAFGIRNHTGAFYKLCIKCREQYRENYKSDKAKQTSWCEHGHFKNSCGICVKRCEHGKFPYACMICNPQHTIRIKCEHNVYRGSCRLCNLCKHNNHRRKCKQCAIDEYIQKTAQIAPPPAFKDEIISNNV